jgi:hypothetical protein
MTSHEKKVSWLRHHPSQWQADTLDRAALREASARLRQVPRFPEAAQSLARNMLSAFESHRAVSQLMNQHGRFAFLAIVMSLHHTRDLNDSGSGVTYSRIRELLEGGGLASASRIKVMLKLARARGQLRAVASADKRLRVLEPTQSLVKPAAIWLNGLLQATEMIKPLPSSPDQLTARPSFIGAVLSYNVNAYAHSKFALHEDYPEIRALMSHEYGYLVLMSLLAGLRRSQTGEATSRLPIGDFAQRFSASRGTVRNLLQLAQQEGWLTMAARGGHEVTLEAKFADTLEAWAALEMEWAGEFARQAVHELAQR